MKMLKGKMLTSLMLLALGVFFVGCAEEEDEEKMIRVTYTDTVVISPTGNIGASGADFSVSNISYTETLSNFTSSDPLITADPPLTGTATADRVSSLLSGIMTYVDSDGFTQNDDYSLNVTGNAISIPNTTETLMGMTMTLSNVTGSIDYTNGIITWSGDVVIDIPESLIYGNVSANMNVTKDAQPSSKIEKVLNKLRK